MNDLGTMRLVKAQLSRASFAELLASDLIEARCLMVRYLRGFGRAADRAMQDTNALHNMAMNASMNGWKFEEPEFLADLRQVWRAVEGGNKDEQMEAAEHYGADRRPILAVALEPAVASREPAESVPARDTTVSAREFFGRINDQLAKLGLPPVNL